MLQMKVMILRNVKSWHLGIDVSMSHTLLVITSSKQKISSGKRAACSDFFKNMLLLEICEMN